MLLPVLSFASSTHRLCLARLAACVFLQAPSGSCLLQRLLVISFQRPAPRQLQLLSKLWNQRRSPWLAMPQCLKTSFMARPMCHSLAIRSR